MNSKKSHHLMKTLVIGLDSATWRVMMPLLEQGKLLNLQKLIENGISGRLRSTIPPMTPLAWTSIVTGVNPGKHGFYDFVVQDDETYRVTPINYSRLFRPAIWDILNFYDKKIGVVNFPLAFPAPKVDSFFISGIASPEKQIFTHPSDLMDFLKSKNYRIYPTFGPNNGAKRYLHEIKELTDIQVEATLHLMKKTDWDLMIAVFMGIDWVQHYLWDKEIDGNNAVHDFYQYIDGKLGELFSAVEEDWNIIVLSDHGAREVKGEIHLNCLLEEWGYLDRSEVSKSISRRIQNSVLSASRNLSRRLPLFLRQRAKRYLPKSVQANMREIQSEQLKLHHMIDWNKTKAFSYGYMGKIYIHRKGKYPLGIVDSKENYESLREEIIARLKSLKDPETGDLMIDEIFRREEVYIGDKLESAPDILFNPTDFRYMIYGDFSDAWFLRPKIRVADHDIEGILIMKGKNIRQSAKVDAEVVDITPTLLYLHDLPLLDNLDGRVLQEAFDDQLISKRKVQTVENNVFIKQLKGGYGETEQQEIEKRLRDLGYL
jgi:predicted AlkP superfamily phosphohydrolase/phosphomutase